MAQSQNWQRVTLNLNRADGVPKGETGVYLICAGPPGGIFSQLAPYTGLYAGQVKSPSRDVRTRFREHIQYPRPKLHVYMSSYRLRFGFWYAMASDPVRIDALQVLLFGIVNPPCNNISALGAVALRARVGTPRPIGPRASD